MVDRRGNRCLPFPGATGRRDRGILPHLSATMEEGALKHLVRDEGGTLSLPKIPGPAGLGDREVPPHQSETREVLKQLRRKQNTLLVSPIKKPE